MTHLAMANGLSSTQSLPLILANMARLYSKHGVTSGSNVDISASSASSYIPGILNRLDALERAVRNTTSPISPFSSNLSNLSPSISQNNIPAAPNAGISLPWAH